MKLAAGSNTQTVLPFTGLIGPIGVAVDAAGDLYVTDAFNNRVLKLAAGSNTQTVVPFTRTMTRMALCHNSIHLTRWSGSTIIGPPAAAPSATSAPGWRSCARSSGASAAKGQASS